MPRPLAVVLLALAAVLIAAAPAATAAKKKPFKPRTYHGAIVSTNPDAPSEDEMTIIVERGICTNGKDAKERRGICFETTTFAEYLTFCKVGNGRINGTGSHTVVADYLLPRSGTFTVEHSHRSGPSEAPATIDSTVTFKIGKQKITGTATLHSTNGPIPSDPDVTVCDGSASFELERTE